MPRRSYPNVIKKIHRVNGASMETLDRYWKEAKQAAKVADKLGRTTAKGRRDFKGGLVMLIFKNKIRKHLGIDYDSDIEPKESVMESPEQRAAEKDRYTNRRGMSPLVVRFDNVQSVDGFNTAFNSRWKPQDAIVEYGPKRCGGSESKMTEDSQRFYAVVRVRPEQLDNFLSFIAPYSSDVTAPKY